MNTISSYLRPLLPLWPRSLAGPLLCFGLLAALPGSASHIRAGEIQAVVDPANLLRYEFRMRIYTDDRSTVQLDPVAICFGDNSTGVVFNPTRVPLGNNVTENIFHFSHVFPGPGFYRISYVGVNRNDPVLNLGPNPGGLSFYIATAILIDASAGPNNSVAFEKRPIDEGAVHRRYRHAPGASDTLDHDSLSFELLPQPFRGGLLTDPCDPPQPILTYSPLDQHAVAPRTFTIHPQTGLITWDAPAQPGEYNLAYKVREWRYLGSGVWREVGWVIRDMQITITGSTNAPPDLQPPHDTCVVANTTLTRLIRATDPNANPVTIEGVGGPFSATPPASLTRVSAGVSRFTWTPGCPQVARQPYLATFTARDQPAGGQTPLTDVAVWRIRVIGPPPQRLLATIEAPDRIRLRWRAYACRGAADSIRIYRRTGASGTMPGYCETGVPAAWGYRYVGTVAATDSTFLDTNQGRRFRLGTTYCYRIYATWPQPGGGESLASDEVCVTTGGLLPQLVNATVDVTDAAAGQTTVRWTVGSPGPHVGTLVAFYRLFRAADDAPALVLLRDRIPLDDTVYVDTNLNTADRQYQYRVVMVSEYAGSAIPVIDTAAAATTPRLRTQIQSIGPQIDVFWRYQVPWDNVSWHYVYRRIAGTYELIDSVFAGNAGGFYSDRFTYRGLPIDHEPVNCYRILTRGSYVVGQRDPAPTVNWSQETCVKNMPCAPLLALEAPDCAAEAAGCDPGPYANQLTWTPDFTPPCARDLTGYRVYFRPTPESPWTLLATTTSPSFRHEGLPTRLGCYSVTAVDASGSESPRSNEVCPDNCVYFTLPNIVTPNADGINDRLQPLCASPLRRVRFTVYNRWGRRVYESDANPLIQWSGTADNGQPLTDGTYFYRAEVEFDALNPVPRFYKGWVDIAGSRASAAGR